MPHDQPPLAPLPVPAATPRLESVDLLRGLVMVLMTLDHTRDFFSNSPFDPLNLTRTFPALFLTRWITHFCAPVFVFLAGTGAFLATTRGKSTGELSRFLFTRGLWLVLLELTWVNWAGWQFHFNLHYYGIQVIWAIGWSMVALAGLVWLPSRAILGFGIAMIMLHNTLDGLKPESSGAWTGLWRVLHAPGTVEIAPGIKLGVGYPLIPWIGVMAAGYAFGPWLLRDAAVKRKSLLVLGASLTALFVVVRSTNLYGDSRPWMPQQSALFTAFSFLNCEKYPPSLCYLLMTLGPALLLLALFDRGTPALLKPVLVFGRVPLFFYLLHLPLIHGLSLLARHLNSPQDAGFGLAAVYGVWILVVAFLYPVCNAFAEFKRRRRDAWLSYL
jgi:uncharacterized membrane protein